MFMGFAWNKTIDRLIDIEEVQEFTYLESVISSAWSTDIRVRFVKARVVFRMLKQI